MRSGLFISWCPGCFQGGIGRAAEGGGGSFKQFPRLAAESETFFACLQV